MGAWGEDPTSSDDFGELWDGVESAVRKYMSRMLVPRRPQPERRWARVGVLVRLAELDKDNNFALFDDDFEIGIEDIEELMKDEEWIASWRSPQKIRTALTKARQALVAHVKRMHR